MELNYEDIGDELAMDVFRQRGLDRQTDRWGLMDLQNYSGIANPFGIFS